MSYKHTKAVCLERKQLMRGGGDDHALEVVFVDALGEVGATADRGTALDNLNRCSETNSANETRLKRIF